MSAYFVFDNVETLDQAAIDQYIAKAPATVAAYGGTYRAIYGKVVSLEGIYKPNLPVIIEFPSYEQGLAWYNSEIYRELKILRTGAQVGVGYLVDGLPKMPVLVRLMLRLGIGRNYRN